MWGNGWTASRITTKAVFKVDTCPGLKMWPQTVELMKELL